MRFKLSDDSIFVLPGQLTFLHLATIHYGVREYMCVVDQRTNKVYIEEISVGTLEFIEDDSLAQGIRDFLDDKGVLDPRRVLNWRGAQSKLHR